MKTPVLEYAEKIGILPKDACMSQLNEFQQICAGVAWMSDNEGYGIRSAAENLLLKLVKYNGSQRNI